MALMQTMSFGLQFSLQKANDTFYSAIQEYKDNASKLGSLSLSYIPVADAAKYI